MEGKNKQFISIHAPVLAAVIFLCMLLSGLQSPYAASYVPDSRPYEGMSDGMLKFGTGKIFVTVNMGFKGENKPDRYIRMYADIENKDSDFKGKLRVEYAADDIDGKAMMQKSFEVASGETKHLQFALPYFEMNSGYFGFVLCDENDNELYSINASSGQNEKPGQVYFGLLSDKEDSLRYLLHAYVTIHPFANDIYNIRRFYDLSYEDFTDNYKMLDSLDVIVIDGFDTGKFKDAQIQAIKKWVQNGGTLVIGGGGDAQKILKAFNGKIIYVKAGKKRKINTDFGVKEKKTAGISGEEHIVEKVPIEITPLEVKNSETILKDGKEKLISKVKCGNGSILMAEFPLSLEDKVSEIYGITIINLIKNNLGKRVQAETGNSTGMAQALAGSYTYENEIMLLNETNALPNLKLYALILVIYVLLTGPAAYMFTKKKDKRQFLWIIVPAFSVVFSLIIYLIGTSTRIQKPYINYVSTIDLPEGDEETSDISTMFSITSPSNKPFKTSVGNGIDVMPANMHMGTAMSKSYDFSSAEYSFGTSQDSDGTDIIINGIPTFDSVYFKMENKRKSKGTVDLSVTKIDNGLSGYVKNNMSCDLENCIFYHKGTMYYIGNMPSGMEYDMSLLGEGNIFKESDYSYSIAKQTGAVIGGSLYDKKTPDAVKRKAGMIMTYAAGLKAGDSWFYGFIKEGGETGFTDAIEYDKYGSSGVSRNTVVKEKSGSYDIIGQLSAYAYGFDKDDTDGHIINSGIYNDFPVTYKFPEGFTLKKIIYNEETAGGGEFEAAVKGTAESVFTGTAKVKNKKTGKYDILIESGKVSETEDMDKYLDADGSLTIYYDISAGNSNNETDTFTLPGVNVAGVYQKEEVED